MRFQYRLTRFAAVTAFAWLPLPGQFLHASDAIEFASPSSPAPIQLRLRRFEIPFSVDSVGQRPTKVQLFVSNDQGAQWKLFDTQPPTGKTFLFEATSDGEYWFATRTVDASGLSYPQGDISAQLRVRLDASDPVVELHAELASEAAVLVNVRCTDQWPNPDSLRVEYMTDVEPNWAAVPNFNAKINATDSDQLAGQVRFEPPGDWHQLSIRGIAKDLAGNQTIATHQLQRPRLAATPGHLASTPMQRTTPAVSTIALPVATAPLGTTNVIAGSQPQVIASPLANLAASNTPVFFNPAPPSPVPSTGIGALKINEYAANPFAVKAMQILNPPPGMLSPSAAPPTYTSAPVEQIATPVGGSADLSVGTSEPTFSGPSNPAVAPRRPSTPAEAMRPLSPEQITKPVADAEATLNSQSAARPSLAPSRGPTEAIPLPSAAQTSLLPRLDESVTSAPIRHSRSRKFSLDYEVESAGRAGVEEVELWGSTDRGETWKRWGADPDRQTPFDIETNNDGVYGFCIVVVAKNGLATPRPIPQSTPDIFVVVDTLQPVVRISGATYGEGDQTGSLVIRFSCNDENLSNRPISLSFSDTPQGPWTTIAAGLANVGGYVWPADPQLPRQIYLRIDATDSAGNNGSSVLEAPIDVQGLAPKARIRGFNPITGMTPAADPTPQTAAGPSVRFK